MCSLGGKVKGKVHPLTGHEGPERGYRYDPKILVFFLSVILF